MNLAEQLEMITVAEGAKAQTTQFLDNLTAQDPTTAYTSSELITSRLQTTCIGCGIAALIGLAVLRSALNSPSMWYFTLHFTMIPGLLIEGLYFIMALIVPVIALKAFHKVSVVDRL